MSALNRQRLKTIQWDAYFTFSNVLAVISVLITLTGTSATIYYNFFWHPESLTASVRVHDVRQLGGEKVVVSFVMTNGGRQAVPVEKITLIQITGTNAEVADCWNPKTIQSFNSPIPLYEGETLALENGRSVRYIEPAKVTVNNEANSTLSTFIDAKSIKFIIAEYVSTGLTVREGQSIINCLGFVYYDRSGHPYANIFPAWAFGHLAQRSFADDSGVTTTYSYSQNFLPGPLQLLPFQN